MCECDDIISSVEMKPEETDEDVDSTNTLLFREEW